MENFLLWNASYNPAVGELSFFATRVHVQCISQGSRAMVAEMLNDLLGQEAHFESWHVNHFLTNYMTDYPESDDWKDIWEDTWKLRVKMAAAVNFEGEETEIVRTWARDESWDGDLSRPLWPAECVLVADFYSKPAISKAEKAIDVLKQSRTEPTAITELQSLLPEVFQGLLGQLRSAYLDSPYTVPKLSFYCLERYPQQLIISLGKFGESFYRDGANLACFISGLCRALGGTMTWDERVFPERFA